MSGFAKSINKKCKVGTKKVPSQQKMVARDTLSHLIRHTHQVINNDRLDRYSKVV